MKLLTEEEAHRFGKRINELRARRNKLFMLGLTLQRDAADIDKWIKLANDETTTPDQFLDMMEKHVAKMEAEFMS